MKTLKLEKSLALWSAAICSNVATAWAAEVPREDSGDLFVWIFLAFCALIVLAQLIPAIMILLGFAKGFKKEAKQVDAETPDRGATERKASIP